ncbi:hypothetical protein AVEN_163034-1 [Araneus ventricosus]|uniref:Uncharacterized protein n=1 Tax=Araneus ventricosus TaxID=182803 RepID=A0A4Y2WVM0_ARAVE|nr:hypothetical protein AVEN_163034-1 [Araneus ventricosus]
MGNVHHSFKGRESEFPSLVLTEFIQQEYFREIEINRHDIDDLLERFDEGLRWICEKNKKPPKQKKKPDAIWWNPRLEIKGSRVHALRRRFQAQRDPDERLRRQVIFKKEQAEYKLMIK